jgi:hypothetical protein
MSYLKTARKALAISRTSRACAVPTTPIAPCPVRDDEKNEKNEECPSGLRTPLAPVQARGYE